MHMSVDVERPRAINRLVRKDKLFGNHHRTAIYFIKKTIVGIYMPKFKRKAKLIALFNYVFTIRIELLGIFKSLFFAISFGIKFKIVNYSFIVRESCIMVAGNKNFITLYLTCDFYITYIPKTN